MMSEKFSSLWRKFLRERISILGGKLKNVFEKTISAQGAVAGNERSPCTNKGFGTKDRAMSA
jgi:hypothetical protein